MNVRTSALLFSMLMVPPAMAVEPAADAQAAADAAFRDGDLDPAWNAYMRSAPRTNFDSAVGLGNIAFLRGDLKTAAKWLSVATRLKPDDPRARKLLAQTYYRLDDFDRAAPLFRAIHEEAVARQLESFHDAKPYRIEGSKQETRLKFIQTDPLPVVHARVNGGEKINLLLDTGGSEVYLDPDVATKVGAVRFGETSGVFGGGKKASTEQGRVDRIDLGDFVVRNVPVHILSTRRFAAAAGGRFQIDGVLGTSMLSHFVSTIDYPSGELILRARNRKTAREMSALARRQSVATIPFLMAGDHLILARGTVNQSKPTLFLIDTGLAGGGFLAPESTIKDAGIPLAGSTSEGMGGGGKISVTPFSVADLTLGSIHAKDVSGFSGAFPPTLEHSEGVRIGGLVSHQFFRPYAVTFDFDQMRLIVEKPAT